MKNIILFLSLATSTCLFASQATVQEHAAPEATQEEVVASNCSKKPSYFYGGVKLGMSINKEKAERVDWNKTTLTVANGAITAADLKYLDPKFNAKNAFVGGIFAGYARNFNKIFFAVEADLLINSYKRKVDTDLNTLSADGYKAYTTVTTLLYGTPKTTVVATTPVQAAAANNVPAAPAKGVQFDKLEIKNSLRFGLALKVGYNVNDMFTPYAILGMSVSKYKASCQFQTQAAPTVLSIMSDATPTNVFITANTTDLIKKSKTVFAIEPGLGAQFNVGKIFVNAEYKFSLGGKFEFKDKGNSFGFIKPRTHLLTVGLGYKF